MAIQLLLAKASQRQISLEQTAVGVHYLQIAVETAYRDGMGPLPYIYIAATVVGADSHVGPRGDQRPPVREQRISGPSNLCEKYT